MLNMALSIYDAICAAVVTASQIINKDSKEIKNLDKDNSASVFDEVKHNYVSTGLSKNLINRIIIIASGNSSKIERMITTASKTNDILDYVYYYMANDNAQLLDSLSKSNKEFANGVAEYFGFGKIYLDEDSIYIGHFNAENMTPVYPYKETEYLFYGDDVNNKRMDNNYMALIQGRAYRLSLFNPKFALPGSSGVRGRIDENGLIHPIFFQGPNSINPVKPHRPVNMDDNTFFRFENALQKYFPGTGYYYEMDQDGLWNICIPRENGTTDSIIIDDGTIMGGAGISILGMYQSVNGSMDTIFVKESRHPVIVQNILSNPFYIMSDLEYQEISVDETYFENFVYHYIDFSNTEFIDLYSAKEKYDFEKRLLAAIKVLGQDVRLRLNNYTDPYNFELVSDKATKSPMSKNNTTSSNICEGLSIEIRDIDLTIRNPEGFSTVYKIEYEEFK